jgi:RimJ/RimL family protein N-acetyltransferase
MLVLRTFDLADVEEIAQAIDEPLGWNAQRWGLKTPESIATHLRNLLQAHARGECHPVVYSVNGKIAGISRFLRIDPGNLSLEIGGTSVAPPFRRSFVNSHAKFLLLTHAFESLGAERVEFRVDCANYVSQIAVLRIGARFEGRLRRRQVFPSGDVRDGFIYSVVRTEWPLVKRRLEGRLRPQVQENSFELEGEVEGVGLTDLARGLRTARLWLRPIRLAEKETFLRFAKENRAELQLDFPQSGRLNHLQEVAENLAHKAHVSSAGDAFHYGIWAKNEQVGKVLIGLAHIKSFQPLTQSAEIGYFIAPAFRRQGFASEVILKFIDVLQSELQIARLVARVRPENQASRALIMKLGFTFEGCARHAFRMGTGAFSDLEIFARIEPCVAVTSRD